MTSRHETFVFVGDTEVGSVLSDRLAAAGFAAATDLDQADVVFTYSPMVAKLEDLYFDTGGILETSKSGSIFVDLSPATPSFARELFAIARVNERFAIDAPLVVQNIVEEHAFSDSDNLSCFVGGEEDSYKRVKPMLDALVFRVIYLGGAGAGQTAKVAATLQSAAALIAAVESRATMSLSETPVDKEDVFDALSQMGIVSPSLSLVVDAMQSESFKGSFTVGLILGEVASAVQAADDHDLVLPQAEAGFRLLELLAIVGGVDYNPAAMALAFEDDETCGRFNIDWKRAEDMYSHKDHNHDHNHAHDSYEDEDYFSQGFSGFSAN